MRTLLTLSALLAFALAAPAADPAKAPAVLNFKMKDIDGKDVELSKYAGKVVMFVNVASKCGATPQYKQLQGLHEKYGKDGLVVIGVPANEFGTQEPGTDSEIKEFCESKYHVTFPMMSKVVVKGEGMAPLYQYLTSKDTDPKFAGDIRWNFTKFLVSKKGEVVARFDTKVKPDAKQVTQAIEAELKK